MLNVCFPGIQFLYLEFGYDTSHSNYMPKIYELGKFIPKPAFFFCLNKSGTRLLPVLLQLQVMTWYITKTYWIMSKNEKNKTTNIQLFSCLVVKRLSKLS